MRSASASRTLHSSLWPNAALGGCQCSSITASAARNYASGFWLAQQLRQLGDVHRDPSCSSLLSNLTPARFDRAHSRQQQTTAMQTARSVQTHLCIHTPVVVLPAEHPAPSGAPSEQTTETSTSSALQLTFFSPLTIRNCLFLPAAGGADRASVHGSEFFCFASGILLKLDW
jgi:hypothetical protein